MQSYVESTESTALNGPNAVNGDSAYGAGVLKIRNMNENLTSDPTTTKPHSAKKTLSRVALFLGEVRDGLTMINMQSAFLITSKGYTEKQAGIMFFVFGLSQFIFQTPAGYLMDYSDKKLMILGGAAIGTTCLTVATALFAQENGANLMFMVFLKFLQGAVTALIPPGLNSITQGIVGTVGMTSQVSQNEMMNHLGTAIIVLIGSLMAYELYPDIGLLFIVSPIACAGVIYFLSQIRPSDIDHNAARGLDVVSKASLKAGSPDEYSSMDAQNQANASNDEADSPMQVLRDPVLIVFIMICFTFNLSNGTILPLVMQTLAINNGGSGILMSGFCIIVAQSFMVLSASICGKYAGVYGRKGLFLIGILSVPVRCAILSFLLLLQEDPYYEGTGIINIIILSTQILDGVGAGVLGTMYVLVTSDISGGTGRFSLTLGLTTTAMSIGGTVSGYLGEALAQDISYRHAFMILGVISLIPAALYMFCMPETLRKEAPSEPITGIEGGVEEKKLDYDGSVI